MTITLTSQKRTEKGSALQSLRANDMIPAIIYGPKQEPQAITIDAKVFARTFEEAGESTIVALDVDGASVDTVINAISRHPLTNKITHVDFYAVQAGHELEVAVPLVFVGEAPGIKKGGTLNKVIHELEVRCMPKDMPHEIEIDLSVLTDIGTHIRVEDLKIPKGVTPLLDPEETIVALAEEAQEEEVETTEEVAPEVIGEKTEDGKDAA